MSRLGVSSATPAALAVSGGGDSAALMHLFAGWCRSRQGFLPTVLTVDHGVRRESSEEAALVAQWAQDLGLAAQILPCRDKLPSAGLEEKARAARYRLLGEWCAANGVEALFVAHTLEDQAETFLLRLGRGSGVDGLSAMADRAPFPLPGFEGLGLFRPLLDIGRADLRVFLRERGIAWFEDPMNADARFARVRMRQALPLLEASGIPVQRIAEAAKHLQRARTALDRQTDAFLADYAQLGRENVLIDAGALAGISREISLRVLSSVLMRVSGMSYRPRFARLEGLLDAVLAGSFAARTLSGCRVGMAPKALARFGSRTLLVVREKGRKAGRETKDTPVKNPTGTSPGKRADSGTLHRAG